MKVSIIVPAYNAEATIARCIDSILAQTLSDFELIIIDDGSNDRTEEICTSYCDDRIRYFKKENGGVSTARNMGISVANGEYVGFVDADDYVSTDICEKMYNACIKCNADIGVCDYEIVFDSGKITSYSDVIREGVFAKKQILEEVLPVFLGHVDDEGNVAKIDWAIIRRFFRKDFLDRIGLRFDETLQNSEDCLFSYIATYNADCMVYLKNEKLYINARNSQSLTRRYLPDYWEQRCRLMRVLSDVIERFCSPWETETFPLFIMRSIRPSFTNIAYGFGKVSIFHSVRDFKAIVKDPLVRKMCEVLNPAGLNEEWRKLFEWCMHKRYFTLYFYYMDVTQHNKLCHFIRRVQKAVERRVSHPKKAEE